MSKSWGQAPSDFDSNANNKKITEVAAKPAAMMCCLSSIARTPGVAQHFGLAATGKIRHAAVLLRWKTRQRVCSSAVAHHPQQPRKNQVESHPVVAPFGNDDVRPAF